MYCLKGNVHESQAITMYDIKVSIDLSELQRQRETCLYTSHVRVTSLAVHDTDTAYRDSHGSTPDS